MPVKPIKGKTISKTKVEKSANGTKSQTKIIERRGTGEQLVVNSYKFKGGPNKSVTSVRPVNEGQKSVQALRIVKKRK